MTAPVVLYAGSPAEAGAYERHLTHEAATIDLAIELRMDAGATDPAEVDYLVFAASGPVRDFRPYTRLKAILNLWAGVAQVLALAPPREVPLVRMVEEGLTLGMLDYVTGHVMRHHLGLDRFVGPGATRDWGVPAPPLARERRVTVLGLGALGRAVAERLAMLGFATTGWSRTPKDVPGVRCLAGEAGFGQALDGAEIAVLLLPQTPATLGLIDRAALARLAPGAALVNAARGPILNDADVLDALDRGALGHATLDVFAVEPLPEDDPYRAHPRVTVTPHIASVTRPETASKAIALQIARAEAGERLRHVVRRESGY
ncbi:MAG: 2-hydroxyacid dehydrogenase [Paracoccaceae bacterium]